MVGKKDVLRLCVLHEKAPMDTEAASAAPVADEEVGVTVPENCKSDSTT